MLDTTYLIVPDVVAKDCNLNHLDKLLFGAIYSLTKQHGYCWATNDYFGEYFNVSSSYISKSMKRLENRGYIFRELDNTKDNKFKRKVFVDLEYINKLQYGAIDNEDENSLGL